MAQSLQNVQGHRVNRVTPDRVRDRVVVMDRAGSHCSVPNSWDPTYAHAVWPRVTIITLEHWWAGVCL